MLEEETPHVWIFSLNEFYNLKNYRAGIVLEWLGEILIEKSLCLNSKAINNQEEYEVLISMTILAEEMAEPNLCAKINS